MPLGLYSPRYRDFLVETVPLGEQLGDLLDKYELSGSGGMGIGKDGERVDSGKVAKAPTKIAELTRYAESKARAEGWALKKGEKADPEKAREELRKRAEETHNKAAEAIAAAKAKASAKASEAVTTVEAVIAPVEEKLASASDAVVGAVLAVQDAVTPDTTPPAAVTPASTKLIYEQRPRELDATPIPAKKADNALYTGPPLPIGFEPAPGYEVARPPPAPKGDLKPATPPPAPLPLVAPAVKTLASNEPILGQLAATIDNLAKFVEAKTDDISGSATNVLVRAQGDIEKLAQRLEKIKAEETAKLETSLKKQASEYSSLLLAAEKDLVERLDTQEEDWKKAFDEERRHLVAAYREKLDKELETQHEIINHRLKEEVIAQGIELQRRWVREIKVRVEQERGGRLAKLEELEGGIRKLEKVTKENEEVCRRFAPVSGRLTDSCGSQILSEAVRARKIFAAVKAVEHQVDTGAPFNEELCALKRLVDAPSCAASPSPDSPTLLSLALSSVPETVASTGIDSFASLAARFSTSVAPQLRRAALLPEHGGIFAYLTSYAASMVLLQKEGWAEGDDVISVIARANFWLNIKDLDLATREVNQLKGAYREALCGPGEADSLLLYRRLAQGAGERLVEPGASSSRGEAGFGGEFARRSFCW